MERNGRKGKRTLTMGHGMRGETARSSRQEKLIERLQVNQELRIQKNLRSNCFEINGRFMNQLLEENVKTCDEIGIQENPNQIFLSEDYDLDDSDDSKSNSGPAVEIEKSDEAPGDSLDLYSSSEPTNKVEIFNKFAGINKIIRIRCSRCKATLENVDENYLRFARSCFKCQSPILLQCRKCTAIYKHFQSMWDHVQRSCKPMEINPSIRELVLEASNKHHSDHIYSSSKKTSDLTPTVITLDSDSEDEKNNDNFVNTPTTLPIRIKSIESLRNVVEKSTDSEPVANDTRTEEITPKDRPTKNEQIDKETAATSSASKDSIQDDYKCHRCEFKAESADEIRKHVAKVHTRNASKKVKCSKCKSSYKSYKHQQKCWKKSGIRYKCKFCEQCCDVLSSMKRHLITKHSQLFNQNEMDGIMMEIKLKGKAVREMSEKAYVEKLIKKNGMKNLDKVSKIGNDVDEKIAKLNRINEFLRIRCCKCKVTFEKVEEKIIVRCPDCKSELLYRCRLCDKFFAYFDEAWLHISYKCEFWNTKIINNTQSTPKKTQVTEVAEVVKPPEPTYNCSCCNYKTVHKWQITQHLEMSHSYLNGDLEIKVTACPKCGLRFKKPQDCKTHEELYCDKEMILICEFCQRVERRVDALRIHLLDMHSQQLESIYHLEDIIDVIKMKAKNMKGNNALPVLNGRDSFMVVEEV